MWTRTEWNWNRNPLPSEIKIWDYFEKNYLIRREIINVWENTVNYTEWVVDFPHDLSHTWCIYCTWWVCLKSTIRAWSRKKKSIFEVKHRIK